MFRAIGSLAGARATSTEGVKGFLCVDRTVRRCGSGVRGGFDCDLLWAAHCFPISRRARARYRLFGSAEVGHRLRADGARDPPCGTKSSGRGKHTDQTVLIVESLTLQVSGFRPQVTDLRFP